MLPEGWSKESVSEVCQSVFVGVVIKPSQHYVSQDEGIKAFRSANVREGRIDDSDWVYFSRKGNEENKKSKLLTGDVLIVRTGYPGTACVVSAKYDGCNAIDIVIARPDLRKIIPTYLCLFTNSECGKAQIANLQGGMAQKHLNVGAYQQVEIPLPPLPEQKKIAAILSTWDRAIEVTEKLLANSQQQKKALMQQLLTGKKRLPGFTGEWHKRRLSDCCHVQMGSSPKSEFYNDAGVGLPLLQGNADIKDRRSAPRIYTTDVTKTCKVGDILLSVRAPVGNVAISAHHACIGRGVACIQMKAENLSSFIYQSFLNLEDSWSTVSQGSTFEAVSGDDLRKTILYLPTLPEQKAIASVLTKADEEITLLKSDLIRLRQEKKALMQQLLTGKRRVKIEVDAG